jgi:hypothetical protein
MEESEYKSTYNVLASVRCVFEKALTSNRAKCSLSSHFWLADREGYACKNRESSDLCGDLLKKLRENSIFVLKLHEINGPLPHNMELRVQVGGLTGLAALVEKEKDVHTDQLVTDDIHGLLNSTIEDFVSLDALPYSKIMQSVVQFQGRQRRQR